MRPTASYAKNAISKDDLARLKKEKVRYDIALTQHALLLFPEKKKKPFLTINHGSGKLSSA